MSDDRAIVYFDPKVGAWVYRASSVGRSLRCLSSARQGYDPLPDPDYLVQAAQAGHRYEVIAKSKLRGEGYKISGEQGNVDFEVMPGVIIRGHLDGSHCIAPLDPVDRMLEVKSMSQRVFSQWMLHGFERFPEYAAQVAAYMRMEGHRRGQGTVPEAVYAVINRDTDEMDVRVLKEPPADFEAIVQKVALCEQFASMQQLPACDSASQYACPYDYLCDRHEVLFEEIEEGKEATLKQAGDKYVEVLKQEKIVKDNKETLRNELRTALGKRDEVRVPGYLFTNKIPKPKKSVDLVGLRKKLGDELDEYLVDSEPKRSLRVYPNKKEKNDG